MSGCEQNQELISRMLDEDLSEEEKALVAEHLRVCPDCAALYAAFSGLSGAIQGDLEEPPASLRETVMAAVRREALAEKRPLRLSRPMRSFLAAAACLALLTGVSYVLRQPLRNAATDTAAPAGAAESAAQEPEIAMFRMTNDENGMADAASGAAEENDAAAINQESAPEAPAAAPVPAPGMEDGQDTGAESVVLADSAQWDALLELLGLSETAEAASAMDAGAAPDLVPLYEIAFDGQTLLVFSGESGLYAALDGAVAPVPVRCTGEELEGFLLSVRG